MSDFAKGFTFTWEIENFSMLPLSYRMGLGSNSFVFEQWKDVEWCLILLPKGIPGGEDYATFFLCTTANVPELKIIHYLTVVSTEPSSNISGLIQNNDACNILYGLSFHLKTISDKKQLYLPNDTLTLRCSLKPADKCKKDTFTLNGSLPLLNFRRNFSSRTSIQLNRRSITLPVRNIQELIRESKNASFVLETALKESSGLKISLNFSTLANNGFVKIEIRQTSLPFEKERICVKCRMTVISAHKQYQHSAESTHLFQLSLDDIWNFPDFLITSNLTQDKYLDLDDTLLLQCEFAFSSKSAVYHSENNYTPLVFEAKGDRSVSELATNLEKLYLSGLFCDVTLRAGGETIPAHKNVLWAMSPVFRAMFQKNMKEKDSNVVEIEDVDPDTLRRMLTFMYSNALEDNLSSENACLLFTAADKYELDTLRRRCAMLLVSSLSVASVCDVLVLADAHQDNFLLTAVHNFICRHANETFNSEHWMRFMELDPKLSGKVMHQMWIKKQQL